MIVHRRGEDHARVAAYMLIPHDPGFDLGSTLAEASSAVALNHPHCARFCVLGVPVVRIEHRFQRFAQPSRGRA